jgi:sulfonate transport system substrate-binding protein
MYAYYDFDMTIRDSDIAAMESTMQFMLDNGMIEKAVDVNSLVIR